MITKIQKWGNSHGVRLSKDVLRAADLDVGDAVDVEVRDGAVSVTPVKRVRGGVDLRALVARIPKRHKKGGERDWGAPAGREVW